MSGFSAIPLEKLQLSDVFQIKAPRKNFQYLKAKGIQDEQLVEGIFIVTFVSRQDFQKRVQNITIFAEECSTRGTAKEDGRIISFNTASFSWGTCIRRLNREETPKLQTHWHNRNPFTPQSQKDRGFGGAKPWEPLIPYPTKRDKVNALTEYLEIVKFKEEPEPKL